jgi:hypothetical protein
MAVIAGSRVAKSTLSSNLMILGFGCVPVAGMSGQVSDGKGEGEKCKIIT